MSANIRQFLEAAGVDITSGRGKRLVEQHAPTGLGIFDYPEDEDDINPEKFKAFVKKISKIKQEFDDDYAESMSELKTVVKRDKAAARLLANLTADIDEYNDAKDKYKPADMEIALNVIERRYKEIQRYIDLKNT